MSQNILNIPPIINGYIKNSSTVITRSYINSFAFPYATTGIPYEFRINFTALPITVTDPLYSGNVSGLSGVIDGTFIKPGQWLICQNGYAYLIVKIITSDPYDPVLVIRDVDLYNALFDLFQFNLPIENPPPPVFNNNLCVIVSVSPDGIPIVTYQGVTGQATWAYDVIGKLAARNSVKSYYAPSINNDLANGAFDYSTYNIGQVVFLSSMRYTGTVGGLPSSIIDTVAIPVNSTNTTHVSKSFGVVSAVNSPEVGNIYIRPFGNSSIPFYSNLPGNVGDILYYDSSDALATGTYTTPVKPASNALPLYIKLANKFATTLYGITSGGDAPSPIIVKLTIVTGNTAVGATVSAVKDENGVTYTSPGYGGWSVSTASTNILITAPASYTGLFCNFRKMMGQSSGGTLYYTTSTYGANTGSAIVTQNTAVPQTITFTAMTSSSLGNMLVGSVLYFIFDYKSGVGVLP